MSDVEYALHLGIINTPDRRVLGVQVCLVTNIDHIYLRRPGGTDWAYFNGLGW